MVRLRPIFAVAVLVCWVSGASFGHATILGPDRRLQRLWGKQSVAS